MAKLAANLTMLFGEMDFLERFEAAARAGFRGVEFLFPYPYDAHVLKGRLREHGLVQVLHNLPAGNWAAPATANCGRPPVSPSLTAQANDRHPAHSREQL